jgi:molybdopterin-guanine dinucleotide biosynthesis protein A
MGVADKALVPLAGRPLIAHVIEGLAPQVGVLALGANGDTSRLGSFGLPIIADEMGIGPLAGILAGMRWAEQQRGARWITTVPTDTPFIPTNLVARLRAAIGDAEVAVATSRNQLHPVVGLWDLRLADNLDVWLRERSHHKVETLVRSRDAVVVDFEFEEVDPFFNINRPKDLERANSLCSERRCVRRKHL